VLTAGDFRPILFDRAGGMPDTVILEVGVDLGGETTMRLHTAVAKPGLDGGGVNKERLAPALKSNPDHDSNDEDHLAPSARDTLSPLQACVAFVVFVAWLALFAGGILVDTRPYRTQISPTGVAALQGQSSTRGSTPNATDSPDQGLASSTNAPTGVSNVTAWVIVLLCFLPINLAWICATASVLGSYGSRAELGDDKTAASSVDTSRPFVSAVIRGFFVYLFMISGLLLLDETPFSNPAPGQYIRLAGFLSLFSFIVSYQPSLFNGVIQWALDLIREKTGAKGHAKGTTSEIETGESDSTDDADLKDSASGESIRPSRTTRV